MSKITDAELDLDLDIMERMPKHVIETLRAKKLAESIKPSTTFSHVHEKMGNRLDMPVPHDLRGKRVRVTLEVIEEQT